VETQERKDRGSNERKEGKEGNRKFCGCVEEKYGGGDAATQSRRRVDGNVEKRVWGSHNSWGIKEGYQLPVS